MPRLLVVLLVVLVVLVGGMFALAGRNTVKEPVRMEKAVALENLAN